MKDRGAAVALDDARIWYESLEGIGGILKLWARRAKAQRISGQRPASIRYSRALPSLVPAVKTAARRLGVEVRRYRPPAQASSARPDVHLPPVQASSARPDVHLPLPRDFSAARIATIGAVEHATMTSAERIEALITAVEWIERREIPGAVVECGVWMGGSVMAAALTLNRLASTNRDIWLYDTFAGMTEPESVDLHFDGRTAEETLAVMEPEASSMADWCNASIDEVRRNVESTGYPADQFRYVKGLVEETLPRTLPGPIALLRLDTDFYASTRVELERLYPLVASGGVVIIDDYGAWQGARRAVDEFLVGHPAIYLHRIDVTGRLFIKP